MFWGAECLDGLEQPRTQTDVDVWGSWILTPTLSVRTADGGEEENNFTVRAEWSYTEVLHG